MNDAFNTFVGQEQAVRLLRFQVRSYKETGYFPPVLISSKRGNGKTLLSELIGKELTKPRICINASTIDNAESFVNQIWLNHCQHPCILHFDESHTLANSKTLEDLLLSALSINKQHTNIVDFKGQELIFDNNKISWIFSTTNIEQHSLALINRLKHITLAQYSPSELSKILLMYIDNFVIDDDVLTEIIKVSRDTARNCTVLAEDLNNFTRVYKLGKFGLDEWKRFKKVMSVNPLGLNQDELFYLRLLSKHTRLTLTGLASALEQDRTTVQRAIEPFLLKKALITVETGGRRILNKGLKILEEVES